MSSSNSDTSDGDFSSDGSEWIPENEPNKYKDDSDDDIFESPPKRKSGSGKKFTPLFQKSIKSKEKTKYKHNGSIKKSRISSMSKEKSFESDSSVDDHLVTANEIDLSSKFYRIHAKSENLSTSTENQRKAAEFECNQDDESNKIADNMKKENEKLLKLCKYLDDIEDAKIRMKEEQKKSAEEKKKSEKDKKLDIANLLSLGECFLKNANDNNDENSISINRRNEIETNNNNIDEEDEEDEWEDVLDDEKMHEEKKDESIEVRIDVREKRKLKKLLEIEALIKIEINRVIRRKQYNLHKVSLLCHLAHGIFCNRILNDPHLQSSALKLFDNEKKYHPNGIPDFEFLANRFKKLISLKKNTMHSFLRKKPSLAISLSLQLQFKEALCKKNFVLMFIILLRALGIQCRMVFNIVPLPIRPSLKDLCTAKMKEFNKIEQMKETSKDSKKISLPQLNHEETLKSKNIQKIVEKENVKKSLKLRKTSISSDIQNNSTEANDPKESKEERDPIRTRYRAKFDEPPAKKSKKEENINIKSKVGSKNNRNATITHRRCSPRLLAKFQDRKNQDSSDKNIGEKLQDIKTANNVMQTSLRPSPYLLRKSTNTRYGKENVAADIKPSAAVPKGILKNTRKSSLIPQLDGADDESSDSGSEILKPSNKLKTTKSRTSKGTPNKINSKESPTQKSKIDIWPEVYCKKQKKWLCINLFSGKVGNVESIRRCLTSPIAYVFAFNTDETIKDITVRYCPNWVGTSRKYRVDQEWLNKALKQYCKKSSSAIDKAEDRELNSLQKPLPKTISEYKNNPLYALERHLLKFEAIYPRDIKPLGYIRGEPVFPRDSVYILHSRDKWYKEHAQIVKSDEKCYKIVSQLKWDRESQSIITVPLEIFGIWQTEPYIPPEAKNGIVPKNEYGNVELFHEKMLPRGCVHLNLPGLSKICRQLNIDYALAVIGFDFHKKSIHPVVDGIIVCKEFEKKLLQIYKKEQKEIEQRAKNKITERAFSNWKKLIKGMFIKSKLEKRYNFNKVTTSLDHTSSSPSSISRNRKRRLL